MSIENTFLDKNRGRKPLNLDITHVCPLECPRCARQEWYRNYNEKVPGTNMDMDQFQEITDNFRYLAFCGTLSDPIHHPKFIEMLKICYEKSIAPEVNVASSFKTKKWFVQAFQACPTAQWIFGIDGMPEQSHLYRKNQDGKKLFDIMLEAKKHLSTRPVWQYIVFKYNQDFLDTAIQTATENGVNFIIINSTRWHEEDHLKPTVRR